MEDKAKEKKKRAKKPLTKGRKIARIIILSFFGIILALIAIIAIDWGPFFFKMLMIRSDTGYKKVDTELTREQRLADLDYMYDIVCLQSPSKDVYEKAYGISYEDVYNRYRDFVTDCDSEIEYLGYMSCFLSVIPGQHNYMSVPDYDRDAVNGAFSLIEEYGNQKLKNYAYSWKEDFHDDVEAYLDYNIIEFAYFDGHYVGVDPSNHFDNTVGDYYHAELISIDGRDPKDMCFDFLSAYAPTYDLGNDCFYRVVLMFNDGIGVKHTAEILMPDGTTVTADLYEDPGFASAMSDGCAVYKDLFPKYTQDVESKMADIEENGGEDPSYEIYTDAERKLVYVDLLACVYSDGEKLAQDMKAALEKTDAETVIIDVRSNGGGSPTLARKFLFPEVFSHDQEFVSYVCGTKNDYTKHFYTGAFYKLIIGKFNDYPIRTDDEKFYYAQNFSVEGHAAKNYKIYLLTSQDSFSSADIMARVCKEYDNAVLVGTNTGGEGICGEIFCCTLPESHFMFTYMGSTNVYFPDDGVYGTMPDIYIPYTVEEYYTRLEMSLQGEDPKLFEKRLEWDKTLLYVLDLVDEGNT
ncbi:MAG: hypothetical protein K6E72_11525 [Saccharofermentans sp.]|nr:hypothetical protein [Saccharofermentans sp.]